MGIFPFLAVRCRFSTAQVLDFAQKRRKGDEQLLLQIGGIVGETPHGLLIPVNQCYRRANEANKQDGQGQGRLGQPLRGVGATEPEVREHERRRNAQTGSAQPPKVIHMRAEYQRKSAATRWRTTIWYRFLSFSVSADREQKSLMTRSHAGICAKEFRM